MGSDDGVAAPSDDESWETIHAAVAAIVAERLQVDVGAMTSDRTVEEWGFTSLTFTDALMGVEQHFGLDPLTQRVVEQLAPTMTLDEVTAEVTDLVVAARPSREQ